MAPSWLMRAHSQSALGRLASAVLVLEVVLWVALVMGAGLFRAGPRTGALDVDFRVFYTASVVLQRDGNPYDYRQLAAEQQRLFADNKPLSDRQARLVRAGNPPLFYWLLIPLTRLPFQTAAYAWIALLFAVAAAAFFVLVSALGWRRRVQTLIVFLLSPVVVLGACYGNVHALAFAALAGAFALAPQHGRAAGVLLAVGWLKPQLVFPLAALLWLVMAGSRREMTEGFVTATIFGLLLTVTALGPHVLSQWILGLMSWSHDVNLEPNVASLTGLYVTWMPAPLSTLLQFLSLAVAAALTLRWWLSGAPRTLVSTAPLWVVWFLASPFAHFPDEILLVVPGAACLNWSSGMRSSSSRVWIVGLWFGSLLLFADVGPEVSLLSVQLVYSAFVLRRLANEQGAPSDGGALEHHRTLVELGPTS